MTALPANVALQHGACLELTEQVPDVTYRVLWPNAVRSASGTLCREPSGAYTLFPGAGGVHMDCEDWDEAVQVVEHLARLMVGP